MANNTDEAPLVQYSAGLNSSGMHMIEDTQGGFVKLEDVKNRYDSVLKQAGALLQYYLANTGCVELEGETAALLPEIANLIGG
jgi:hypothetical protein